MTELFRTQDGRTGKVTSHFPAKNGWTEWIDPGDWSRMICPDCQLVHQFEFRVRDGRVEFKVWRANQATAARRRRKAKRD